jgi:integrase
MQKNPPEPGEKWQANGKQIPAKALSKNSIAYWKERIQKPTARKTECANYCVRISHLGKRIFFNLNSPEKDIAARTAAVIYKHIIAHGWDDAISIFRPDLEKKQEVKSRDLPNTIGTLIHYASLFSSARPSTVMCYSKSLRRIVADLMSISKKGKADTNDSRRFQAFRDAVDAIPLAEVSPERVLAWREHYVAKRNTSPSSRASAMRTANTHIRNSKSLFSRKYLTLLKQEMDLPSPLPFEGISLPSSGSTRYRSKIDARKILEAAHIDLLEEYPESYKIFLLALNCGLRVSEIDHLLWRNVDLENNLIIVENTEYHQLKSEDSAGQIKISDQITDLFKHFKTESKGLFVVDEMCPALTDLSRRKYRLAPHLRVLKRWLRMKGVTANKPIHELRKEVGSIIARDHGIYAASRFLRHSDIKVTADYYLDMKIEIVPEF